MVAGDVVGAVLEVSCLGASGHSLFRRTRVKPWQQGQHHVDEEIRTRTRGNSNLATAVRLATYRFYLGKGEELPV